MNASQPVQKTGRITLREATRSDGRAIGRIYNDTLPPLREASLQATSPQDEPQAWASGICEGAEQRAAQSRIETIPDAMWDGWVQHHEEQRRPIWLAVEDGKPLGWISTIGFSERPNAVCTCELSIYVARAGWRRGIGSLLLSHALENAPRYGLDRLMAFIWEGNAASLGLFRSFGFEDWGCLPKVLWSENVRRDMHILGTVIQMPPRVVQGVAPARARQPEVECVG